MHGITSSDHMVSLRQKPWHGLGVVLPAEVSTWELFKLSRLDWEVEMVPVYTDQPEESTQEVCGYKAIRRQDTKEIFSIVGDGYTPIQNKEVFEFVDGLIANGIYETAGSLFGGRSVWILIKLPEARILGERYDNYLLVAAGHDGKMGMRIINTPVRVVCNNTMNLAIKSATSSRQVTVKHTATAKERMGVIKMAINNNIGYISKLNEFAEGKSRNVGKGQIESWVKQLFPLRQPAPDVAKKNNDMLIENFYSCLLRDDLANYRYSGWGFLQAASDMAFHTEPIRKSANFSEHQMRRAIEGHPVIERALEIVQ